jgi:hypothetical protein
VGPIPKRFLSLTHSLISFVIANIQDAPSPPTSPELEEGEIDELAEEKEAESHHHTEAVGSSLKKPEGQPIVHNLPADTDDDIYD